jgi:hypothetical protein
MVGTSMVAMFVPMYPNTLEWDDIHSSESRA